MSLKTVAVLIRCERAAEKHSSHPRHLHPPLALKYIEAAVHGAIILDNWLMREAPAVMFEKAMAHHPAVVVIEGNSSCMEESLKLASMLKGRGVTTVATGQQVAHAAHQHCPGWIEAFDIPVLGEPEEIVPIILNSIVAEEPVDQLKTQCLDAFKATEYFLVETCDALAVPAFNAEELLTYTFPFPVRGCYATKWAYVQTSWGCTHADRCVFCSDMVRKSCGSSLRLRSHGKVVDEIERLLELGAEGICFEDNNLFNSKKHIIELCREIIKRNLDFCWIASVRADYCDEEVLTLAAESGAVLLKVGVESATPHIIEMLDKSRSGESWLMTVKEAFELMGRNNIGAVALVMIGCPGETEQEILSTIDFVLHLAPDYVQVQIFSMYPDSLFYKQLDEKKKKLYSFSGDMNHYEIPAHTASKVSPRELLKLQGQFYHDYYLRAGFVIPHLARFWRYYMRPSMQARVLRNVGREILKVTTIKRDISLAVAIVFVMIFICIAQWSGSTLSPITLLEEENYPYSISTDLLQASVPSAVEHVNRMDDGIMAHENVWLDYRMEIPESGIIPLYLIAKGTPAAGCYPSVSVKVDGRFQDALFCTSEEWGLYRFFLDLSRGRHDISLSYQNDGFHFPEDRGLGLKLITVGTEPEDVETYYRWETPVTIPCHKMSIQSYTEYKDFETLQIGGGNLGDDIYFKAPGRYQVTVVAEMKSPEGGPARLKVLVDGEEAAELYVADKGLQQVASEISVDTKGLHRLEIVNINSSEPRHDVILDTVTIGDVAPAMLYVRKPLHVDGAGAKMTGKGWAYYSGEISTEEEVILWSNGCMMKTIHFERDFSGKLIIRARGEQADGVWPRMTVMMGNDQLARFDVNSLSYEDYSFDLDMDAGNQVLMIIFDNDAKGVEDGDINLAVMSLEFSPEPGSTSVSPSMKR